ncbi:hypothetical protein KY284_035342 [Solanum tuberosum]|nr:hypothetical protein KY284_035342 [Solanum tuberosum]
MHSVTTAKEQATPKQFAISFMVIPRDLKGGRKVIIILIRGEKGLIMSIRGEEGLIMIGGKILLLTMQSVMGGSKAATSTSHFSANIAQDDYSSAGASAGNETALTDLSNGQVRVIGREHASLYLLPNN